MPEENIVQEYIVTARKWRPLQFKDVVGQEHITITLQNAIRLNRNHHAYLFSGPRGVGKTTTARILARALNCSQPENTEPCNRCDSCEAILSGRSLDVIEIDGASNNSVDDVRKLRENAKYPPISGNYKMYIIDEVHMLSNSAFNALLKTLEEPPPHLMFVFATTEAHKVPSTILSRCQRFDFRRMEIENIVKQLKYIAERESIGIDEDSLLTIAKKADGSMRDGQSIFDQVVAFCGKDIKYIDMANALHLIDQEFFFRISKGIKNKDFTEMFAITQEIVSRGYDLQECLGGLLEHFRNILTVKVSGDSKLIECSSSLYVQFQKEAELFTKADLLRFMSVTAATEQALRYAPQPRVRFELALVQMASMDSALEISELLEEIKSLRSGAPLSAISPQIQNEQRTDSRRQDIPKDSASSSLASKKQDSYSPYISEPKHNYNENIPTDKDKSPIVSTGGTITADVLQSHWSEFLSNYAISKHGLFKLNQRDFIEPKFFNGEIVLKAADQFTLDSIIKKKQTILNSLADFYGAPVSVKIIIGEGTAVQDSYDDIKSNENSYSKNNNLSENTTSNKDFESYTSNEIQESDDKLKEKHPIEQSIVRLFGAKEIG